MNDSFEYIQIYFTALSLEHLLLDVIQYTESHQDEPRDIVIINDDERNCWDAKLYYFKNDVV